MTDQASNKGYDGGKKLIIVDVLDLIIVVSITAAGIQNTYRGEATI